MQANESLIVVDTKSSLIQEVGPVLEKRGFRGISIDFTDMLSSCGYTPWTMSAGTVEPASTGSRISCPFLSA